MLKKMLFIGLILILSTVSELYGQITQETPDSVLGAYTKCKLTVWEDSRINPKSTEAEYNSAGKLISEIQKKADKSVLQSRKLQYNEQDGKIVGQNFDLLGNLSSEFTKYKKDNSIFSRTRIYNNYITEISNAVEKLDGKGNLIESFNIDSVNGKINNGYRSVFKYDDKNNLVSISRYKINSKGESSSPKETTFKNTYDPSGRLIEIVEFDEKQNKAEVIKYKYDAEGVKTQYVVNKQGTDYLSTITCYNKKGNIVKKTEFHPNGKQSSILTRKYDDNDRLIEYNQLAANDKSSDKWVYEYDEFGNRTKATQYWSNDKSRKIIEYTYSK